MTQVYNPHSTGLDQGGQFLPNYNVTMSGNPPQAPWTYSVTPNIANPNTNPNSNSGFINNPANHMTNSNYPMQQQQYAPRGAEYGGGIAPPLAPPLTQPSNTQFQNAPTYPTQQNVPNNNYHFQQQNPPIGPYGNNLSNTVPQTAPNWVPGPLKHAPDAIAESPTGSIVHNVAPYAILEVVPRHGRNNSITTDCSSNVAIVKETLLNENAMSTDGMAGRYRVRHSQLNIAEAQHLAHDPSQKVGLVRCPDKSYDLHVPLNFGGTVRVHVKPQKAEGDDESQTTQRRRMQKSSEQAPSLVPYNPEKDNTFINESVGDKRSTPSENVIPATDRSVTVIQRNAASYDPTPCCCSCRRPKANKRL